MSAMSATEIFDLFCAPLIADRATGHVDAGLPDGTWSAALGEQDHFGGLKYGVLYFQRCRWCRTPVFRRMFCPACASPDLDLERSEGTGVVSRSIVVRRNDVPHNLSLIAMSEGFRLQGSVVGMAYGAVRPGTWVRVLADAGVGARDLAFKLCTGPRSSRS